MQFDPVWFRIWMEFYFTPRSVLHIQTMSWGAIRLFSSSQCPRKGLSGNGAGYKDIILNILFLPLYMLFFSNLDENGKCLPGTTRRCCRYPLTLTLWILLVDHNLPPHPRGFWFPLVCLHITGIWFTPSPQWVSVFSVCFVVRPQGEGLHIWAHLYIDLGYFLGCERRR